MTYRCADCGAQYDLAADAASESSLSEDLAKFVREHADCSRTITLDTVVRLPEPRRSGEQLLAGARVDGDVQVHAVAAGSPLALCSGAVVMVRETAPFDPQDPSSCTVCSALLRGTRV